MTRRIKCKTPSTGKSILIAVENVSTSWVSIVEAPDFSVPDPQETYTIRDLLDNTRTIRPGEIFFVTPLAAKNKSSATRWIEVRVLTEAGVPVDFGRVKVPAYDTAFIPLQGRSLFKRIPYGLNGEPTNGDRIQVQAEFADAFDVWAAAEEKLSAEHIGVEV